VIPKCETCAAWDSSNQRNGACRRRAPAPLLEVQLAYSSTVEAMRPRYPVTLAGDGCFDHIPKPVEG